MTDRLPQNYALVEEGKDHVEEETFEVELEEEIIDEDKNSPPKRICSYAYKKNMKALNLLDDLLNKKNTTVLNLLDDTPKKKTRSEPSVNHETDSLMLFNSIIGRLFNKPETLEKIGMIEPKQFQANSFVSDVRKIDRP